MREALGAFRMRAALLLLEAMAARAGCAMVCPFDSSAELEAAVIRGKLANEVYHRKRRCGYILAAVVAGALLAALLWQSDL
jgi:hypothetical protein